MKTTFEILEISKILETIASYTNLDVIKSKILDTRFSNDQTYIKERKDYTIEFINYFSSHPSFSFSDIKDHSEDLKFLISGGILSIKQLYFLKLSLLEISSFISEITKIDLKAFPKFTDLVSNIKVSNDLIQPLFKSIESEEKIFDNATSKLATIRRNIKLTKSNIETRLQEYIAHNLSSLQDNSIYYRYNSYCLAFQIRDKNKIEGSIIDYSYSKNTVYISPSFIKSYELDLNRLLDEESNEIYEILCNLSRLLAKKTDELQQSFEYIYKILYHQTISIYAINNKAKIASISSDISLEEYSHPLLDQSKVVSNTFQIKDKKVLLITGPNTGGKTVAIKSIALACYLNQMSLPLTVKYAPTLPIFNRIHLDIGDEQSIEQSLSTFSSHLYRIRDILKYAKPNDLIVFDELCSGTDPEEGSALAIAIIKKIIELNCFSLITTHYPAVKSFALSSKAIIIAAMGFDKTSLSPTYKFFPNSTESSFAFSIASKIGLDSSLVTEAMSIYQDNLSKNAILTKILEDKIKEIDKQKDLIEEMKDTISKKEKDIEERKAEIDKQEESILEKAKVEANKIVKEYQDKIVNLYEQAKLSNMAAIKKNIDISDDLIKETTIKEEKQEKEFKVGDEVYSSRMNINAVIIKINNDQYHLRGDSLTFISEIDDLQEAKKINKKKIIKKDIDSIFSKIKVDPELNLIGLTVSEALPKLERYLSTALNGKLSSVRIIHGIGSGALKKAVHSYLSNKSYVKKYYLAPPHLGSDGATIVEL